MMCTRKEISLLKGLVLPFSFGTYRYREYLPVEREYGVKEAEALLREQYDKLLARMREKEWEILQEDVRMDTDSGVWVIKGEVRVREKIGEEIFR